jgi:hypothetical protein
MTPDFLGAFPVQLEMTPDFLGAFPVQLETNHRRNEQSLL